VPGKGELNMMTSLERFNASILHKDYDRIPYSMGMVPELRRLLLDQLGISENPGLLDSKLRCDRKSAGPVYTGTVPQKFDDGSYTDMFGVKKRNVQYPQGNYSEAIENPLRDAESVSEIEKYNWPRGSDFDYSSIPAALEKNPDYPYTIGYFALGWYSWDMCGMEKFLENLVVEPELSHALINAVSDFGYDYYLRVIEAGKSYIGKNFRCIHLADDWATQNGLMISIETYREYFKKHYKRIIAAAHNAGLLVEFHCCGSVEKLIPELIDTGIDILNPIQTSAHGMIPEQLKENYGRDIAFSGGLDVQTIMPFGTPEEVKKEVHHLLDTLGADGGYILQPSHSLQIDTPIKNIEAMLKAIYDHYGLTEFPAFH
jgi:uroporphyrinogen decarboxylase